VTALASAAVAISGSPDGSKRRKEAGTSANARYLDAHFFAGMTSSALVFPGLNQD
jgi:hypothetical protein